MAIDFSECEICTPAGSRKWEMCRVLWDLFPYDRHVYSEIMDKGKKLYTMTNYALFQKEEFLGNVGLYPVSIWMNNEAMEVVGVGAVATVPRHRPSAY